MQPSNLGDDLRVLVIPVTRRDGEVTRELLERAGVSCGVCRDPQEMAEAAAHAVGALLLTDAVLEHASMPALAAALGAQPSWSDIPVIVLVREQHHTASVAATLAQLGNVTVLDRPVSARSMTSSVLSALRDRRKQYQIRDQLRQQAEAEQELKQADRRKDEFLATLAHELRNPLAPLSTGLQVLARLPGQTEQAVHLRRMMERQMRLMVKLIDELLDVSRISTGKVVLQSERVDMRQVVASALEGSRPLVDSARHVLDVRQPDGPVWTFGDPARLSQVVSNLVNNAAKYTPDGGRIEVALNQQGNEAVLTVSDTGVGLPGDKLEEVFEMFSQVNRTLERSQGGLGIGLSLVRKLLELHGGSVAARSPGPDQGSTFTVRLPMLDATDGPAGPRPASHTEPSRKSCRLLIIDDNEDAADAIAALAASEGHVARTAYSAAAGLAAASEFHPDVIICDIGMPQMDGYQLAARLRQEPELAQAMLVAVTGWGGEAARGRSLQAGFDRHLTKPMTYEAFTALFADR